MSPDRRVFLAGWPIAQRHGDARNFPLLGGAVPSERGGSPPADRKGSSAMLNALMFVREFLGQRLRDEDRGVTMVEYGLMVAAIALIVVVGATFFGNALSNAFQGWAAQL
jgi:pilus assembly protein Flp/PilA